MQEAKDAFKAKQAEEALIALKKSEPLANTIIQKIKVYNAIGWTYFSEGKNKEAEEYLLKAFQLSTDNNYPQHAEKSSNNLGILKYTANDLDLAEKYFSNQWSQDSETSKNYIKLIKEQNDLKKVNTFIEKGVLYTTEQKFTDALTEYNKALQIEPKNLRALEYKGASYYALRKYTEAITEYNKILEIEPKNLNALEYKGVNYYALTQYNEAIAVLKQAQAIEPDKINIVINLIKSYCASDQVDQAKKLINNALFVEKKDIFQSNQELKAVCEGKGIKLLK